MVNICQLSKLWEYVFLFAEILKFLFLFLIQDQQILNTVPDKNIHWNEEIFMGTVYDILKQGSNKNVKTGH